MKIRTKEYSCTDMGVASTLIVFDFELLAIRQPEPGERAYFVFKHEEGIEEIEHVYFYNKIDVPPFKFMMALKTLKSRLYHN